MNRDTERMFAYHEATKHSRDSVYRSRHTLDWANMPDPFRHYGGVPVIDLPAEGPAPVVPALDVLRGRHGEPEASSGAVWLSLLLFYSASISASKRVPSTGYRYSLRVNPSSGNLHPTEFHFATRGLASWDDGLYHYRPSSHMVELRGRGGFVSRLLPETDAPLVFVLSSLASREAWKYRSRAYRYCLHDAGHAWQCLALAARALGCDTRAVGSFFDDQVAEICGLSDEWPMLLIEVSGPRGSTARGVKEWWGGAPNRLSGEQVEYPLIDAMHASSKLSAAEGYAGEPPDECQGEIPLSPAAQSAAPFGFVVRGRRSALDFRGGFETIGFDQLSTLLEVAVRPLGADFGQGYVQLYLYVHRVRGLERGVYRHCARSGTLQKLRSGDQRLMAAALSLGQDLAGNSCVTFSMIADLARAARVYGNRGYRYVHFAAGAIGQRLYIAAEAMGFQSTGIGAFYDDEVNAYLEIPPECGQVVYHFACGYAVPDDRLSA